MKAARVLNAVATAAVLMLVSGALGACAGGCTGNPATDNLGCSIANQGKYRRDAIAAQQRAQAAMHDEYVARSEYESAQRELERTRGQRLALQDRVNRANRELAFLEGQLQARRTTLSDAEYRLRAAELERLNAQERALSNSTESPTTEREVQALEDDIARLRKMLQ